MSATTPELRAQLLRLLEPAAQEAGVDLEDLDVQMAGRRRLIRLLVDADGGVDLDRVADVSHHVSAVLDAQPAAALLGQSPYVLEVSSPGVDRPLTLPRHWRRAHSRLVQVTLTDGTEVVGRITASGDTSATVDVAGTPQGIAFDQVRRAQVQVEFRAAPADAFDTDDMQEEDA